jgi:hypothetical protein
MAGHGASGEPGPAGSGGRRLPERRRQEGAAANAGRSLVSVEGPIYPRTLVTVYLWSPHSGSFAAHRVEGRVLEALGALVDNPRRDVVRVRRDRIDELFARYQAADYGRGRRGFGIYDLEGEDGAPLCVWLVAEALVRHETRDVTGSLRLVLARNG